MTAFDNDSEVSLDASFDSFISFVSLDSNYGNCGNLHSNNHGHSPAEPSSFNNPQADRAFTRGVPHALLKYRAERRLKQRRQAAFGLFYVVLFYAIAMMLLPPPVVIMLFLCTILFLNGIVPLLLVPMGDDD